MKTLYIITLSMLITTTVTAQNYMIDFTGTGAATTVDSVKVENLSQCTSIQMSGADILNLSSTVGISGAANANNESIQIYPNPSSGSATISYQIKEPAFVTLRITDILGRELYTLVENKLQEAGGHNYELRITNYELNSGLYFVKLQAGDKVEIGKVVVIK